MYLCSRMIADFVRYLEAERRYSPLTVRNYRHDVEQFLAWLGVDDARFEPRGSPRTTSANGFSTAPKRAA